jgi:hypothetical protein
VWNYLQSFTPHCDIHKSLLNTDDTKIRPEDPFYNLVICTGS